MKKILQKYLINASIKSVWQALVDSKMIEDWSGGPAKMSAIETSEFSLWGGDIYGKNVEVFPNQKLVQEWQEKKWDKPSKVTFNLKSKGDKTEIELIHENVPDSSFKDITLGWKDYYLGPLKKYLEDRFIS